MNEFFATLLIPESIITALTTFVGLLLVMLFDTIRIVFVTRGDRKMAWTTGFICSLIYVLSIGSVFSNLSNFLNIFCYAAGFATGNVLGLVVEEKLAIGHIHLKIISPAFGLAIAENIRSLGIGVTEIAGKGKNGNVSEIHCGAQRKDISKILDIIHDIDATAFVTANEVQPIHRGFWQWLQKSELD